MRVIRDASEGEVIAGFLSAEIESERHNRRIQHELREDRRPRSLVDTPDLADEEGNSCRRSLLGRGRGWGWGEGMFAAVP